MTVPSSKQVLTPEQELLDSADLQRLTGIASSTWRFWATQGTGPASFKIGRRRVWRRSVIEAWLAEQETAAAGGPVGGAA